MMRTGPKAFGRAELESLDRLRPHLARAAMLAARWKMERLRAAADALGLVGIPAVVLTGDCRVITVNSLAGDLGKHLLWLARDRLGLTDERASAKLRKQVAACVSLGSAQAASSFPAWDALHN